MRRHRILLEQTNKTGNLTEVEYRLLMRSVKARDYNYSRADTLRVSPDQGDTVTNKTSAADDEPAAAPFATVPVEDAKRRDLTAMTAAALTMSLMLSMASVALSGRTTRAAVAAASFGRAFRLNLPPNSADYPDALITEKSGRWSRGVELRLPNDAPSAVD